MHKRILSASVSVRKETSFAEFQFLPGINILFGADAEDIVFTLAGIFGGIPPLNGKAEIQWCADTSLFVDIIDGACGIEDAITHRKNTAQLVKDFHKQRYLYFGNAKHILDGSRLPAGISSASELLQEKLRDVLAQEDDRPLFIINFLERLDGAAHLQPIFEALLTTGRQAFIAVPHYYEIKTLEEMPYDTAIHTL